MIWTRWPSSARGLLNRALCDCSPPNRSPIENADQGSRPDTTSPHASRHLTYEDEGLFLREAILRFLEKVNLTHGGPLDQTKFIRILMRAGTYPFGIAIEATGEAKSESTSEITVDHFAEGYFVRMNCDDELNTFYTLARKGIDTAIAMDRYLDDRKAKRKRPKSK